MSTTALHIYPCSNLFKCKNQTKCLHFSQLCDKTKIVFVVMMNCHVSHISLPCPLQYICFGQSIVCDHLSNIKHQNT